MTTYINRRCWFCENLETFKEGERETYITTVVNNKKLSVCPICAELIRCVCSKGKKR